MRGIGFDDGQIALAVGLFTLVILLLETPSGILADRWSRKGVLIIASTAMALCSLLAGLSDNVLMYTAAISLIGVYYAMYSGTYESVIYDAIVDETGSGENYEQYYGRFQIISSTALISGSLLSGIISSQLSLQAAYFLTIPFMILSIIVLITFKEPNLHKKVSTVKLSRQFAATIETTLRAGPTRIMVVALVLLGLTSSLIFEFNQLWYLALSFSVIALGFSGALIQACLGIGGAIAYRIARNPFIMNTVLLTMIVSSLLLTSSFSVIVVASQVVLQSLIVALAVIVSKRLHDSIGSTNRAGVISAISTMTKLVFIPLALLFGYASDFISIFDAAWIIVTLTILVVVTLQRLFMMSGHKKLDVSVHG